MRLLEGRCCRASVLALAGLALAGSARSHAGGSSWPPRPRIGQRAPALTLEDLEGRTHRLADLRADPAKGRKGHEVVLVWWSATAPAVAMTDPILSVLHRKFARQGVRFLAIDPFVSVEPGRRHAEGLAIVKEFKRIRGVRFPILLDGEKQVSRRFGARRVPEVVLIDRAGVLRYRGAVVTPLIKPGERRYEAYLEDALKAVLAGKVVRRKETRTWGNAIPY